MSTAAASSLMRREFLRFLRQPSRVIAAVGTPIVMWAFLASGFGSSVRVGTPTANDQAEAMGYTVFLVPGMVALVALFSAIFSAMTLIEDRNTGVLPGILVSPAPRSSIVLGKVVPAAATATIQALVIIAAAFLVGARFSPAGLLTLVFGTLAIGIGVAGFGLAAAWMVNSSQGFHGIMNLVLMPMWVLSGSVFPQDGAATWMQAVMTINPLSWPIRLMHDGLAGTIANTSIWLWVGTVAVVVAGLALPSAVMGKSLRTCHA